MVNFRYWGYSKKTKFYGCKALKMANIRYGGIPTKVMFQRQYYLKMANSDIRDILQKNTFYGYKTLKMANFRYWGYSIENYISWMKGSEYGKFQILGVFYRKPYFMDAKF